MTQDSEMQDFENVPGEIHGLPSRIWLRSKLFWHFLVRLDNFCIVLRIIFQFSLNNLFHFMLVVAMIWISRAEEGKLGTSGWVSRTGNE